MSGHNAGIDYGRKLMNSGIKGARSGEEQFLRGQPLAPYLNESAHAAIAPALIGAFVGALGSRPGSRHHSPRRVAAFAMVGGLLGFTAALAWQSRRLTVSVMSGAKKGIDKVREEHWLERHPIDYA